MTKEELYKLSLDSYYEYPLLAELMAIRDERFKDEQQDSMLCVNGYVGVDTLNNYVKLQQENKQLKENYERLYNENCKLRERHNINDISLLDENYRLENNWNRLKEHMTNAEQIYKESDDKYIKDMREMGIRHAYRIILYKMQELEQRSIKK